MPVQKEAQEIYQHRVGESDSQHDFSFIRIEHKRSVHAIDEGWSDDQRQCEMTIPTFTVFEMDNTLSDVSIHVQH